MTKVRSRPPPEPAHTWRQRATRRAIDAQFIAYSLLFAVLLLTGYLWPRIFITVPEGHHGVLFRYFYGGTLKESVWRPGVHVIAPWNHMTIYEVRLQEQTLELEVLSEEGLDLIVRVSVRYRPHPDNLGYLHEEIGTAYFDRLIKPEVAAHVRRIFGERPAHEIYSSANDVLQALSQIPLLGRVDEGDDTAAVAGRQYVLLEDLKLLDIELPPIVHHAIAGKYNQEQLMLEYKYRLDREESEAERKRTEAAGIRDFTQITGGSFDDLVRWRGLDATLELAKSPNSKVVVLGGGQGSNPMMLNLGDTPPPSAPAAPSAPAGAPAVSGPAAPP